MEVDDLAMSMVTIVSPVNSELLCFLVNRSHIRAFDDLVKIASDFYTEEEITSAHQLIDVIGHHLPKRKGPDKSCATIDDIVKVVLNPGVKLLQFYAVNLARLPPVSATHCNVSALLSEIQALRMEVLQLAS